MAELVTNSPLALYLPPSGSAPVIIICTDEGHDLAVTFTKHPVEQGAPITDHARSESAAVTLKCMASRTPVRGEGYTDADQLWEQLQALQKTPALIDAITIGAFYGNMGVESVSRPIDVKTANAIAFSLKLTGIRIVQNKLTRIVVARDPRAQPTRKAGGVMVFSVAETDPDSRNVSALIRASGDVR
jgi:hypothetical protein